MAAAEVNLRDAGPQDRDFLLQVYSSTRAEELVSTGWTDEQKSAFCLMQFEAQDAHYRSHYPSASYQVIESGGSLAGRLYVDRWTKEIRIMDIALLAEFRGRGIGTQLLHRLMKEAADSMRTLSIHVERYNPALHLYDRLGFRLLEDKGVYLLLEFRPETLK